MLLLSELRKQHWPLPWRQFISFLPRTKQGVEETTSKEVLGQQGEWGRGERGKTEGRELQIQT